MVRTTYPDYLAVPAVVQVGSRPRVDQGARDKEIPVAWAGLVTQVAVVGPALPAAQLIRRQTPVVTAETAWHSIFPDRHYITLEEVVARGGLVVVVLEREGRVGLVVAVPALGRTGSLEALGRRTPGGVAVAYSSSQPPGMVDQAL